MEIVLIGNFILVVADFISVSLPFNSTKTILFVEKCVACRLYFVCIVRGVACRSSPVTDDRCSPPQGIFNRECVVGTLTEDGQWICIVESNNEKQNGTFLP